MPKNNAFLQIYFQNKRVNCTIINKKVPTTDRQVLFFVHVWHFNFIRLVNAIVNGVLLITTFSNYNIVNLHNRTNWAHTAWPLLHLQLIVINHLLLAFCFHYLSLKPGVAKYCKRYSFTRVLVFSTWFSLFIFNKVRSTSTETSFQRFYAFSP